MFKNIRQTVYCLTEEKKRAQQHIKERQTIHLAPIRLQETEKSANHIIWAIACIMISYLLTFPTLALLLTLTSTSGLRLLALPNSFGSPFRPDIVWWMYIDFSWNSITQERFIFILFINSRSRRDLLERFY